MELSYQIVEILKEFSSKEKTLETHPMSLSEVRKQLVLKIGSRSNLGDVQDDDFPTRKMVRTSMKSLLEMEAILPEEQRTIRYTEKIRKEVSYKSNYWYENCISDAELKFLIDSALYANIINQKNGQKLVKNIQNLSGKKLSDMTMYAKNFGETKYTQNVDVLLNVEILMQAIKSQRKVSFDLNVYDVNKVLKSYNNYIINPHYVVMGNGRYFLVGTYDNSEKCYYYRVDLMTKIKITKVVSVDRLNIPELKGGIDMSKYMFQHPYMISGNIKKMKLRVNKSIFTQIVDWFGTTFTVLPNTETIETVDISVEVCENAMKYWLLQYGENVQALDMGKDFAENMQKAAKIIYEKYGTIS